MRITTCEDATYSSTSCQSLLAAFWAGKGLGRPIPVSLTGGGGPCPPVLFFCGGDQLSTRVSLCRPWVFEHCPWTEKTWLPVGLVGSIMEVSVRAGWGCCGLLQPPTSPTNNNQLQIFTRTHTQRHNCTHKCKTITIIGFFWIAYLQLFYNHCQFKRLHFGCSFFLTVSATTLLISAVNVVVIVVVDFYVFPSPFLFSSYPLRPLLCLMSGGGLANYFQ